MSAGTASARPSRRVGGSTAVAAGILISRVFGLVRDRVLAYAAGLGPAADGFLAALRVPNVLQNLLGEQALSASVLPLYRQLLEQRLHWTRRAFALRVLLLLTLASGVLAAVGVLVAPWLVRLLVSGWTPGSQEFELVVLALRWLFPMAALLVLAAWCLAILNSHQRFFLPYAAPVLWNVAIVTALIALLLRTGGEPSARQLVLWASLGGLAGGALQLVVQLPVALRLLGRPGPEGGSEAVTGESDGRRETRLALRRFGPAFIGRGAGQVGSFVELHLASRLSAGTVASLGFAARPYQLALALLGTSVVVPELPALSALATAGDRSALRRRLRAALGRAAFLTVPGTAGLALFAPLIVAALFQNGRFQEAESWRAGLVCAVYAAALVPTVLARLHQNVFFALGDTRTPAVVSWLRLVVLVLVASLTMRPLDRVSVDAVAPGVAGGGTLGAVGLALGSVAAALFELAVLATLNSRRHELRHVYPWRELPSLLAITAAAMAAAWAARALGSSLHPIPAALLVVAVAGLAYFGLARLIGHPRIDEIPLFRRGGGAKPDR